MYDSKLPAGIGTCIGLASGIVACMLMVTIPPDPKILAL
jgi:tetrahydromethanopterin S-methyltransferase subunit F